MTTEVLNNQDRNLSLDLSLKVLNNHEDTPTLGSLSTGRWKPCTRNPDSVGEENSGAVKPIPSASSTSRTTVHLEIHSARGISVTLCMHMNLCVCV